MRTLLEAPKVWIGAHRLQVAVRPGAWHRSVTLKHSQKRTITVPLRKICSAIPAVALISGGIVFSASGAPSADLRSGAVADSSPVVVVPDVALTLRLPAPNLAEPSPLNPDRAPAPRAPAAQPVVPVLPPGTDPTSSSLVTLDSNGIPVRALEGYRLASTLTDAADPGCNLDWALVAAIGRVESNYARFGGNVLDTASVARPGIIGIPLDGGNGTARITDTDGGLLDRDTTFDRAVGPMQFIPGTWSAAGADADSDGVENPQDMDDDAAAAVYLCSGPGDLSGPDDLRAAILRYNASDSYVRMVAAIADAYRQGVTALPAHDLAPASIPSAPSPVDALISRPDSRSVLPALPMPASAGPAAVSAISASAPGPSNPASAQPAPTTAAAASATTTAPTSATAPAGTAPTSATATSPVPAPTPTATSTAAPSPDPTATAAPTSTPTATSTAPTPEPTVTASPAPTGTCAPAPTATTSPTPVETCLPTTCLPTSEPAAGCPTPTATP